MALGLGRKKKTKIAAAVDTSRELARQGGAAVTAEMDHLLGTLSQTRRPSAILTASSGCSRPS